MRKYVSRIGKRFPERWDELLNYRRLQRGQYTHEEFKSKVKQIVKKRNDAKKKIKSGEFS